MKKKENEIEKKEEYKTEVEIIMAKALIEFNLLFGLNNNKSKNND